ncbi:alcohol dehydrogenase catalytic domain-containing protein [Enemella sp. A6]|uniref:alcohol dehydrogenase catalytic domain-containing protein n=1 Tax=Enemella sp. A6 TaxID=3440152 RepID=UPI003EBB6EDE
MADTMRAYQITAWGEPAEYREVPVPEPGPGQVLVKVAGVGLCHSDEFFLNAQPGMFPYDLPFTLGHEIAGWVAKYGPGTPHDVPLIGSAVIVYASSPCGECVSCRSGAENICLKTRSGRGYGRDGGLADYVLVDNLAHIVPLDDLDPVATAPLCDAGTTSFHAVRRALPKLLPDGAAVVIGAGGLGGYAVQWLRLLSDARIIAVDTAQHRLDHARELGAHELLLSDEDVNNRLAEMVGGRGADIVLDFVGIDQTLATGLSVAARSSSFGIIGAGRGQVSVSWGQLPFECDLWCTQGSTVADLFAVVELAKTGDVVMDVDRFGFDDIPNAYRALAEGSVRSRAVVEVGT